MFIEIVNGNASGTGTGFVGTSGGVVTALPVNDIVTAATATKKITAGGLAPGQNLKNYTGTQALTTSVPTNGALSQSAGGALAATTYYVKTTWTSAGGGESLPSTETNFAVSLNNVLNVAAPASPPAWATGWNVYVSNTAGGGSGAEKLQNGTPITIGTPWVEPTTGLAGSVVVPVADTTTRTVTLETVTTARTYYITDIIATTTSGTAILLQVQSGGIAIFQSHINATKGIEALGIETQPQATAGQTVTIVLPSGAGNVAYNIFGFEM